MYRRLAQDGLIQKLEERQGVLLGWHRDKDTPQTQQYFNGYKLSPGYFSGGDHPWEAEDVNTRVASGATVVDLRSGAIIYQSQRKAAQIGPIIEAIDAAK